MAFRHSIKRASAYWRRERPSFIVEILIRSLSISFAAISRAGDFPAEIRDAFRAKFR